MRFVRCLVMACVLLAAARSAAAAGGEVMLLGPKLDVRAFGAVGDGKTDDTGAFQAALDDAARAGGGVVIATRGNYLIKGRLSIGRDVALEGIATVPTAWSQNQGTTLLVVADKGKAEGEPFIRLAAHDATLKGVTIYYPEQDRNAEQPVPYPWTIRCDGADNVSIVDVLLVNPYQAINLTRAGRHYLRNVYGHPLYRGLYVDQIYDVGRVENIHFWPFSGAWTGERPRDKWINDNAIAFEFGRTDWQYVLNTFCFGYQVGYRFFRSAKGSANGNFSGIGADRCVYGLLVEDCEVFGLLITNGEFVGNWGPEANGMKVAPTNRGVVQLQNCAFWGSSNRIATIEGGGTVTFNACNFMQWDKHKRGEPAVWANGGRVTVSGCSFTWQGDANKQHIFIGEETRAAVVMGNLARGALKIENKIGERCQIGLNAGG